MSLNHIYFFIIHASNILFLIWYLSCMQVSAKALLETYDLMKNAAIGSGVIGFNLNVANIIAAISIATGQDVACTAESSSCQLFIAPARKDEILSQGDWLQKITSNFPVVIQ